MSSIWSLPARLAARGKALWANFTRRAAPTSTASSTEHD